MTQQTDYTDEHIKSRIQYSEVRIQNEDLTTDEADRTDGRRRSFNYEKRA